IPVSLRGALLSEWRLAADRTCQASPRQRQLRVPSRERSRRRCFSRGHAHRPR
ncbi:hypothetical protein HN011_011009, partial [Eciton burchellii]